MKTYKCKLKKSRLERETYLSRTENHIFALKSSTNTKKSLGSAKKLGSVGLVETNNFCTPNINWRDVQRKNVVNNVDPDKMARTQKSHRTTQNSHQYNTKNV